MRRNIRKRFYAFRWTSEKNFLHNISSCLMLLRRAKEAKVIEAHWAWIRNESLYRSCFPFIPPRSVRNLNKHFGWGFRRCCRCWEERNNFEALELSIRVSSEWTHNTRTEHFDKCLTKFLHLSFLFSPSSCSAFSIFRFRGCENVICIFWLQTTFCIRAISAFPSFTPKTQTSGIWKSNMLSRRMPGPTSVRLVSISSVFVYVAPAPSSPPSNQPSLRQTRLHWA